MSGSATSTASYHWERFSTVERLQRFVVYLACVIAIVVSFKAVDVIPEFLADAPAQMKDLLVRMWPIEWDFYYTAQSVGAQTVHQALMDSLAIAFLATALGLILATPIGFLAARNINKIWWLNAIARFILVATRSISTLLWALFFVAMFGPGALAGTCAIAFHSIGFLGKMLSEALEESNKGSIEALVATGAPWYSRILYGYWPQVEPAFVSIALFRWDINVRESAVLGLVGAGGIGMVLNSAIDVFEWDRVALVLLVILVVVMAAEVVATQLRKRLI
ncbi:MAG: phosphonate ABC transporter, permease protein PhnE [Betaproteobacteria bacterium]|nr:phosphonate ABC transporter, permease protein PhnE [Betaproteobacteria bacterium]